MLLPCLGLHARRGAEAGAEGRCEDGAVPDRRGLRGPPRGGPGMNCIKTGPPGKLILSKRKAHEAWRIKVLKMCSQDF